MAQEPAATLEIIDQFGPQLAYASGQRLDQGVEPDRLVKTHCCFCGQLWLLTTTMNAFLGGNATLVWPAASASLVCFFLNLGLLWYLYGLDQ